MTLRQALTIGYETARKLKWRKGTYLELSRDAKIDPARAWFFLYQAHCPNGRPKPFRADRFNLDRDEWEGITFRRDS